MRQALPGGHYCVAHQGNHSHYAEENCELCRAYRERDEARALNVEWAKKAKTWTASPEAAQRLQGYRDLAQQVAKAQNERDEARAEVAEMEGVLRASGALNQKLLDEVDRLRALTICGCGDHFAVNFEGTCPNCKWEEKRP